MFNHGYHVHRGTVLFNQTHLHTSLILLQLLEELLQLFWFRTKSFDQESDTFCFRQKTFVSDKLFLSPALFD